MKAIKISNPTEINNLFSNLFGNSVFKGKFLNVYAENLFFSGMDQLIPSYAGGSFDFYKITGAVEIEETGFFPLNTSIKEVLINSPFGDESATVSFQAASLIVWLIIIEQVANSIDDEDIQEKIYCTIQDVKHCYPNLFYEDGKKLFSQNDADGFRKIIH